MADIKTFGKELLRGNFGNAIKSLSHEGIRSIDLAADAYRGGSWYFDVVGGPVKSYFQFDTLESAKIAYTSCPELQSILNRRAAAHANGKRWIMRQSGKGKGKEDNSEYADKCRKLLKQPNPFQSGKEWETQLRIYLDLFEWCLILPIYAGKFWAEQGLSEASAMFLIPPYMLSYEATGDWQSQKRISDLIRKMYLTVGGRRTELDLQRVVVIKNTTPRMNEGVGSMGELLLFPDSKVRAQSQPINNIIGAYESRGELISYAGSQGIISPATSGNNQYLPMGLTPDQEEDTINKLRLQYGIKRGQARYIVSQMPLAFSQMGRPTKDLMLFEEVTHDVRALCNAWPYPFKLLAETGSSLNGTEVDALERNFYQDAVIPESTAVEEQLAAAFKAEENGTVWERDYSHVPCMQADAKAAADTLKTQGEAVVNLFKNEMITYNRALEMLGEDTVADGDVYYTEWKKSRGIEEPTNPITQNQNA